MKINTYAAIGHFKGSENMTCISSTQNTKADFIRDLRGNEFVPFVVITDKMFETLSGLDGMDIFNQVQKMTSNYRIWNDVTEYIEQCLDIIENKMNVARDEAEF